MNSRIIFAAAALLSATLGAPALADTYPSKSITVVLPFAAGGASDTMLRTMAPEMGKALGANLVVKNVVGAVGTIGAAEVASAPPDGYTLGFFPVAPVTLQPHLQRLPYDIDSFRTVCRVYHTPVVLLANKGSELRTLEDVVREAKARPNELVYGSSGPGTMPHISMLGLAQAAGIEMKHVPFKGGAAEVMKEIMGDRVHLFADIGNLVSRFDVQVVAVLASERVPDFPDVATAAEAGYELDFSIWGGLSAPAGTPDEIVSKLSASCRTAMESPVVLETMKKLQTDPGFLDAADFDRFNRAEYEKNRTLLQAAGLLKP